MSETALKPVTIPRPQALALLRDMLRIRRFEERCADLYGQMKIRGFLHLYIGEEAVAAGVVRALSPDAVLLINTYGPEEAEACPGGRPARPGQSNRRRRGKTGRATPGVSQGRRFSPAPPLRRGRGISHRQAVSVEQ